MSDPNLNPQPLPPQQQPQYAAAPPAQPGYNTMAIVGFILAFFVSIVGAVLGFVALSQIKRTGEQGRGLAIAAVIIGLVEVVLTIILTIIIIASLGVAAANYNNY